MPPSADVGQYTTVCCAFCLCPAKQLVIFACFVTQFAFANSSRELQNGIYEGIPHGNVKLAYSESFLLNLIHSEFSWPVGCGGPQCGWRGSQLAEIR